MANPTGKTSEEYEKLLREKDKLIDDLRRENLEILENALKQTEENIRLREQIDIFREKDAR